MIQQLRQDKNPQFIYYILKHTLMTPLISDHFSKPARFEFPYNEQNTAYINFDNKAISNNSNS